MLGIAGDERCPDLRADAPLSQSRYVSIAVLVSALQIVSQYVTFGDRIVSNHPGQVVVAIDKWDVLHQCDRPANRGCTTALRSVQFYPLSLIAAAISSPVLDSAERHLKPALPRRLAPTLILRSRRRRERQSQDGSSSRSSPRTGLCSRRIITRLAPLSLGHTPKESSAKGPGQFVSSGPAAVTAGARISLRQSSDGKPPT